VGLSWPRAGTWRELAASPHCRAIFMESGQGTSGAARDWLVVGEHKTSPHLASKIVAYTINKTKVASAKDVSTPLPDMAITEEVSKCFCSFNGLQNSYRNASQNAVDNRQESFDGFIEEYGRFKIWLGNLAAHRSGRGSLDSRLEDASHLANQITQLLQGLQESLDEGIALNGHNDFAGATTTNLP
jgi:hypothetical protein